MSVEQDKSETPTVEDLSDFHYKFDDSALNVGRVAIGFREMSKPVNPKNMTHKEYIHYLAYKFSFDIGKSWDGIERRPHISNWSEEPKHNIKTQKDAAKFLGFPLLKSAPDGIEKRKSDRRKKSTDYRKNKTERRTVSLSSRRKEDLLALKTHKILLGLSLVFIVTYGLGVFIFNFSKGM